MFPSVNRDAKPRIPQNIGVLGARGMGSDLAYACAVAGYSVVLLDVSSEALDEGVERIRKILAIEKKNERLSEGLAIERLTRITMSQDLGSLADADLVIEAAVDSMATKKQIFKTLGALCKPGAVLAPCTSALDVNQIALATTRATDVVGLHFIGSTVDSRVVEVINGQHTAADTLLICQAFINSLSKTGVIVGNSFGFVGGRMRHCYHREILRLQQNGAPPERVDKALAGWGMASGHDSIIDLAELDQDTCAYSNSASACAAADAGQSGENWAHNNCTKHFTLDSDEIIRRCIYTLINEGAHLLEEGVALRAADIDKICVLGYGFPANRGGPMAYADETGLNAVYNDLCRFRDTYCSSYWKPAPLLEQLAQDGKKFADVLN